MLYEKWYCFPWEHIICLTELFHVFKRLFGFLLIDWLMDALQTRDIVQMAVNLYLSCWILSITHSLVGSAHTFLPFMVRKLKEKSVIN